MDRLLPGAIVVILLALAIIGMWLGWRARGRRQRDLALPSGVPATLGTILADVDLAYVATTSSGAPLDRITVGGLGFRGAAHVTIADAGVVLSVVGEEPRFIAASAITGHGRGTFAIDRVVETGGLIVLTWTLGDRSVDSYLRPPQEQVATALLSALDTIAPLASTESEA